MPEATIEERFPVGCSVKFGAGEGKVVGHRGGLVLIRFEATPNRPRVTGGVKPDHLTRTDMPEAAEGGN